MNPARTILLAMARSAGWRWLLTRWPVTRRVVSRFIPGERLRDAVDAVRTLNAAGMLASLNPLGEHVTARSQAAAATRVYLRVLEQIAEARLDANVSVKLTMLGLDLDPDLAARNLRTILHRAAEIGRTVRIDMESSGAVDDTLRIWLALHDEGLPVGGVIQSYLRRSGTDLERLIQAGASIRLVKGAYAEPPSVAFADKSEVDLSFLRLMRRLARPDARSAGVQVAIATHDPRLVRGARALIQEEDLPGWEFQMLYGIARPLQRQLSQQGYRVRIYVSYGREWYPWFMRRLAERPANLAFFLRHLLR